MKFVFTFEPVNGQSNPGFGTTPDPQDPQTDGELNTIIFEAPVVLEVSNWDGWFTLSGIFLWDIQNTTNTWAGRMEIGKMVSPKIGLALDGTKYLGGQPRFDIFGKFKAYFFIN